jgi:hypothetical protein
MQDDAGHSRKNWGLEVSGVAYLKNHTPTGSVVGETPYKTWHRSGRKPSMKLIHVLGCLRFVQVPKEKRKKLDNRATHVIFLCHSISTKQYFIYDPLAETLHRSSDVVFREGKWYTALNAADDAILN